MHACMRVCARVCTWVYENTVGGCGCKVTCWCKRVDPLRRLPQPSVILVSLLLWVLPGWQGMCCSCDVTLHQCNNKVGKNATRESEHIKPTLDNVILHKLNSHFQVVKYFFVLLSAADSQTHTRTQSHTHTCTHSCTHTHKLWAAVWKVHDSEEVMSCVCLPSCFISLPVPLMKPQWASRRSPATQPAPASLLRCCPATGSPGPHPHRITTHGEPLHSFLFLSKGFAVFFKAVFSCGAESLYCWRSQAKKSVNFP